MRYLSACLLFLFAPLPAANGVVASQPDACEDVAAYFAAVDAFIYDGLAMLDEQPGFRDAFGAANAANEGDGEGFLALPKDEQGALISYLRMPGEALGGMDADEIPDAVRDLHDSAVAHWTLLPEMMQTIADESPSAALPFFADLEAASGENVAAQDGLVASCPGVVATWADAHDQLDRPGPGTPEADLVTVWARHSSGDVEGLGYPFVFFANEDDPDDGTPAA